MNISEKSLQVWMLIDVLLILHYSDVGQTWNGGAAQNGRRRGSYDIEVSVVYSVWIHVHIGGIRLLLQYLFSGIFCLHLYVDYYDQYKF